MEKRRSFSYEFKREAVGMVLGKGFLIVGSVAN